MSLQAIRQRVVDDLIDSLSINPEAVKTHRGRFDSVDEIKRLAARSPSVLVATRGVMNEINVGDATEGVVMFVIYVLGTDRPGVSRNDLVGGLAEQIAQRIASESGTWEEALDEAQKLNRIDVTSLAIDKQGVALWEVSWSQAMRIEFAEGTVPEETNWDGFDADHYSENHTPGTDDISLQTQEDYTP